VGPPRNLFDPNPQATHSKSQVHTQLSGERNADGRTRTEEISQSTGRDQQLPKAGDGREPGRRTAQRACTDPGDVGKIVNGKNRYVGNVIRSGIVTIDEIEELHERYNRPALF